MKELPSFSCVPEFLCELGCDFSVKVSEIETFSDFLSEGFASIF